MGRQVYRRENVNQWVALDRLIRLEKGKIIFMDLTALTDSLQRKFIEQLFMVKFGI